jgi:IS30 family transposase
MNRLSMDERQTIIGLLRLNWPERRIARETGFHRATIRRIAREAAADLSKCTTRGEVATDPRSAEVAADPKSPTDVGQQAAPRQLRLYVR